MLRLLALSALVVPAGCVLPGCAEGGAPDGPPVAGDVAVQSNEDSAGVALPNVAPPDSVTADTTGPATVEVAGQTVPTRGVALSMESEDRVCTLTLRNDAGAERAVSADRSVCDSDAILGRRVQIEYAPSVVPSVTCGDDPDCLDTDRVALAVSAVPIEA